MSDFPSLSEIAAEHNILVDYMKYVHDCIDERKLPVKYPEWVWSRESSEYLTDIFE